MALLNPKLGIETVRFDLAESRARGQQLHEDYVSARPFPHVVIDDFVSPEFLDRVNDEFPSRQPGRFSDSTSDKKTGYQLDAIGSDYIWNLLYALNSAAFLAFVEELTGIEGLITDPYFSGAGLHETGPGGYLKVHEDFNIYTRLNVLRRVNLILFLNEDWEESYGGHLELWERDMSSVAHRVLPVFNRAVLFNTDPKSWHGHPDPLTCPEERFRRSIALYYYTAPDDLRAHRYHSTNFAARPGTDDKRTWRTSVQTTIRDFCPPVIWRALSRGPRT